MRILVVEDTVGDAVETILDLVDAGHQVVRCQPVGAEAVPCVGLAEQGECPLSRPVDVVVDVRTGDGGLSLRELGALCAARLGVPIVSTGHAPPPFPTIRTTSEDVVATVASLSPGGR